MFSYLKNLVNSSTSTALVSAASSNSNEDLFKAASTEHGLIVGTCWSDTTSGCYDFTTPLKAQFPNLDAIQACVSDCTCLHCPPPSIKIKSPISHYATHWDFVILTGCRINSVSTIFQGLLLQDSRFLQVKHVYALLLPSFSKQYKSTYESLNISLSGSPYQVSVLRSSILNSNASYEIGIPLPFPDFFSSKYSLPQDCIGLMYHSFTDDPVERQQYYHAYFNAASLKHSSHKTLSIIAINIADPNLDHIAKNYGIKILHLKRLAQPDFLQAIETLGKRDGLVSCDGAITLLQAAYFGTKFMVFSGRKTVNTDLYQDLVELFPNHLKIAAAVVLGIAPPKDFSLVKDPQEITQAHSLFPTLVGGAVNFFNGHMQKLQPNLQDDYLVIHFNFDNKIIYAKALQDAVGTYKNEPLIQLYKSGTKMSLPLFWARQVNEFNPVAIEEICENLSLDTGLIRKLLS